MNPGIKYIQEQAVNAAAQRLQQAARFAALNIRQPAFQKRMGTGKDAVVVRFEWPGTLSIYNPATGELLGLSECGKPDVLRSDFAPLLPSQVGSNSAANPNSRR